MTQIENEDRIATTLIKYQSEKERKNSIHDDTDCNIIHDKDTQYIIHDRSDM
jgi:hypothetical protein